MDQQVSSTKQFMVLQDGRQVGPLKAAELQSQAREGAISPLDSVCAVGSDKWVLGYQVKGLFPAWLAAEIRERLAKGEGVDDLLQQNAESVASAHSAEQPQADDMVLAPLEESGWYWLDEGKRFGPVNVEVIGSMLESGVLAEQSQVARSQGGPWLAPSLFPELAQRLPTAGHHRSPRTQSHTGKQTTASRRMPVAGVVGLVAIVLLTAVMVPITMLESGALSDDAVDAIAGGSRGSSSPRTESPQPSHRESAAASVPEPTANGESQNSDQDPVRELTQTFVSFANCFKEKMYAYLTDAGPGGGEGGPLLVIESFDLRETSSLLNPLVGEIRCKLRTTLATHDVLLLCHWQGDGWEIVEVRAEYVDSAYGPDRMITQAAPGQVIHMIERAKAGDCR